MVDRLLSKNVETIYPSKEALEEKLKTSRRLKIYLGIDPTSPEIHIGNAIALWKLREFQDAGHEVILLIGDFTGMIGDPSDKTALRKRLSGEEVQNNAKAYQEQASKILDFSGKNAAKVEFNSTWLSKLTFKDVTELAGNFTVQQLIERDMFQDRLKKNKPIGLHEFLYPLMQGYDSVAMNVDIEVGGTDQTFNMLVGRDLMKVMKHKEKFVLTLPLLEGTDGRKMSKSYGNSIGLADKPNDMYGKLMSLKDGLISKYFEFCTNTNPKAVEKITTTLRSKSTNPMELKKRLALAITQIYHGEAKAKAAEEEFTNVFQKGERKSDVDEIKLSKPSLPISYAALAAVSGATKSTSEAIRLAENKGLKFNGKLITDARLKLKELNRETLVDIGKRKSVRITWE